MSTSPNKARQFRINPVELVIFAMVGLVFGQSLYSLFQDRNHATGGFAFLALEPMNANPISEGRAPASVSASASVSAVSSLFSDYAIKCDVNGEQTTSAGKVRLTGPLCGSQPDKTQVTNTTNRFHATVFADTLKGKFSTDYIPLSPGSNAIRLEWLSQSGKPITQEFNIIKK